KAKRALPSEANSSATRIFVWGGGAVALCVVTAGMSVLWGLGPIRILYDGLAPLLPYRWSHPPLELARDNQPPERGEGTLPLAAGSPPGSMTTNDGQASVIFDENAVMPTGTESAVRVSIDPLDPETVAAAPPGTRFDSNAYRIDARYAASRKPVMMRAPATVVLRYATGATQMVRADGPGWTALQTLTYPGSLQIVVAKSETFGIFAAVAPMNLPYTRRTSWWVYVIAGVPVIIVLLIGYGPQILARLRSRADARHR
ncbi:MAG TPA: hypothetical protein VFW01_04760, partial [bacterium]|nr:hypothetical protein [bacterium]